MTGASGAQYGLRLLECLLQQPVRIYLLLSRPAQVVINMETEHRLPARASEIQAYFTQLYQAKPGQLQVFEREQWLAPIASGSGVADVTVVCPCTTGTLSSIACGSSRNLLERAADVALKERKKLILVVRETPFSEIHLENMLKHAKIVSEESRPDEVGMNDTVTLYFEDDDEEEVYRLVTSIRGNSLENRISIESPLGKAIEGHHVGDQVEVKVNDKSSYVVEIRKIENTGDDGTDKLRSF